MQGFLSLLLFAAFFYFMMRFGCGAHMVHGNHGGHEGHGDTGKSITDPVCGMNMPTSSPFCWRPEPSTLGACCSLPPWERC